LNDFGIERLFPNGSDVDLEFLEKPQFKEDSPPPPLKNQRALCLLNKKSSEQEAIASLH
jgi:hypothetical protein